jgi:hypothetical protein
MNKKRRENAKRQRDRVSKNFHFHFKDARNAEKYLMEK